MSFQPFILVHNQGLRRSHAVLHVLSFFLLFMRMCNINIYEWYETLISPIYAPSFSLIYIIPSYYIYSRSPHSSLASIAFTLVRNSSVCSLVWLVWCSAALSFHAIRVALVSWSLVGCLSSSSSSLFFHFHRCRWVVYDHGCVELAPYVSCVLHVNHT
jgi:hypothetical protein